MLGYRLAVRLLSPLLLGWVAQVALGIVRQRHNDKAPAGWAGAHDFVRQRFGYVSQRVPPRVEPGEPGHRYWLHAASVGEVLTALPLIEAIAARPATRVLVTTATPTGASVLAERGPTNVHHRYLPIDLPGPVGRFLDRERPDSGWIVETEIWPWLFATAAARQLPLSMVSARLSARTLDGAARLLAPAYAEALRNVRVLARSAADAERFRRLAPDAGPITCPGDLKRVPRTLPSDTEAPLAQPYCLAASTHEREEIALAQAWLAHDEPGLLVIAPRHPQRGDTIAQDLQRLPGQHTAVARRSAGRLPTMSDRLYLADTLGELDRFYARATAVFVGGSLVPRGGHNLLEPARHGVPIATGPHTANFADDVSDLLAADALCVFDDAAAVVAWMQRCSASGDRSSGLRAAVVARHDAALLDRYLEVLCQDGARATT